MKAHWLLGLSTLGQQKLLGLLEAYLKTDQLQDYQAYPKQLEFHAAGMKARSRMLSAGNQLGKTYAGASETAMHLTGEYPPWWVGKRFSGPIVAWASGETGEATRDTVQRYLLGAPKQLGTGMIPKRCLVPSMSGITGGIAGLYDFIYVRHITGGLSMLKFRFYSQERRKWQGASVDWVWFDEEPPLEIYEEGLARTIATKGSTLLTFTPLMGYTHVVNLYMKDPDPAHSDRHWTRMTIHDAQHISAEEREREIARWPRHQRISRIEGLPAMGVGQIFPYEDEAVTIEPFAIPPHWPRLAGIDTASSSKNPRAHPTAAVEVAWDRDHDVLYVLREYRKAGLGPAEHWLALKRWGARLRWAWSKDAMNISTGERGTGAQLMTLYRSEGMHILPHHAQFRRLTGETAKNTPGSVISVERGIHEMQLRFENESLKVFNSCPMVLEEMRQYHRDNDGKIVKSTDDLLDALRYVIMMLRYARTDESVAHAGANLETDPALGF